MVTFSAGGILVTGHGKRRRHPEERRQHQLVFTDIFG